jgi:2-methylcitrate dehydratase PrpD
MNTGAKEPVIARIIDNIIGAKYEKFSQENIEDTKSRLIDVVGCAIGGAGASGNSILLDLLREWSGKPQSTVWVYGDKLPLPCAVMVNCIMCRSYDFEVAGLGGHAPGTVDVTALTIGEKKRATGKEVIVAAILGGDLSARIASCEGFAPTEHFEPTGTINGFGATAVAGRLLGLDKPQMLNAFGILVNLLAGSFQSIADGVHTFKLHQGVSARNAVFSAELAERGFTGIKDPLFSPRGYFPQYCRVYHPELLSKDLGTVFNTRGMHKMVPSCYRNHTTIQSGLEIIRRYNIDPLDISEIVVGVTQSIFDEGHLDQPFLMGDSPQKALFNLSYAIANVLLRKSVKLEHYTEDFVKDPEIVRLAGKVRLISMELPEEWGARVSVKMKDGREFSHRSDFARGAIKGDKGIIATRKEIEDKFWTNVDFCRKLSPLKAKKALDLLDNLEEVDDVEKIVRLLVA